METPKFSRPLPEVREVEETVVADNGFVIIAHDPNSGKTNVFSVIRLFRESGKTRVIGRELPLELARKIAKRPSKEDGMPVKDEKGNE